MGALNFDFTGNPQGLVEAVRIARQALDSVTDAADRSGASLDDILNELKEHTRLLNTNREAAIKNSEAIEEMTDKLEGLKGGAQGVAQELFSIAGISWGAMSFVKQMVEVRSEMQNTEASLKVFLGSAEKASKFMTELSDAAYWNVFEFKDLSEGASQMLAYGNAVDDVIPRLQQLSEIASGTGKDIGSLVQIYDKVKSMDSIDSNTRLSLKNMGIDVVHEIAQIQGVADSAVNTSALGFKELQMAIDNVTKAGGMYYGMMQAKMDNVGDKIGTLQDGVTSMFNDMGKMTEDVLKEGIDVIIELVENWKDLVAVIEVLMGAIGGYKTAMIAVNAINKTAVLLERKKAGAKILDVFWTKMQAAVVPKIAGFLKMENATRTITIKKLWAEVAAQKALTLAKLGAIGVLVGLGIAAGVWAAKRTKESEALSAEEKALKRYNNQLKEILGEKKDIIDQSQEYVETLRSEAEETDRTREALEKLRQIKGFENISFTEFKALDQQGKIDSMLEQGIGEMTLETAKKILEENANTFNVKASTAAKSHTGRGEDGEFEKARKELMGGVYTSEMAQAAIDDVMTVARVEQQYGKDAKEAFRDLENAAVGVAEAMSKAISTKNIDEQKETLQGWIRNMREANDALEVNTTQYAINMAQMNSWRSQLATLENYYPTQGNINVDIAQAANSIEAARKEIQDLRSGAKSAVDIAGAIKKAQEAESQAMSTYKTLTGSDYTGSSNVQKYLQKYQEDLEGLQKAQAVVQEINNNIGAGKVQELVEAYERIQKGEPVILTESEKDIVEKYLKAKKEVEEKSASTSKSADALIGEEEGTNLSTKEIGKRGREAKRRLEKIRKQMQTDSSASLRDQAKTLEGEVQKYDKLYQARSGLTMQEYQANQQRKKALREEHELLQSNIKAERIRIQLEKDNAIYALNLERQDYQSKHLGEDLPAYETRLRNIETKAQQSIDKLELGVKQAEAEYQHTRKMLVIDTDIQALERRVKYAKDVNEQLELTGQLRQRNLQKVEEEANFDTQKKLQSTYSADILGYYDKFSQLADEEKEKFLQSTAEAIGSGVTTEQLEQTFSDIKRVYDRNTQDIADKKNEMLMQYSNEDFDAMVERLKSYYNEIEQIEQDHATKMSELVQNSASSEQIERENAIYKARKEKAGEAISSDGAEQEFAVRMTSFAESIAGMTYEEINKQYSEFLSLLDGDIQNIQREVEEARKKAEDDANTIATSREKVSGIDAQLGSEELTDEERNAILEQREQILQAIAEIESRQTENASILVQKEQQLVILQQGRNMAEKTAMSAQEKSMTKIQKSQKKLNKDLGHVKDGFGSVKSASQELADTLGGALSKESKKALQGVMDIADVGVQSINAIEAVSNAAAISVSTTASTAEKASVILMAIAAIVQLTMAAVKFFSQFTASAKMQEEIDKSKEKVAELEKQQQRLEKAYKREVGSDYYRGMSRAARAYNDILKENNKAIEESARLYQHQKEVYGEDSDKAKEAKEQTDELQDAQEEYADAQKELYDELAESLIGTNVTSFAENLAETLVDAWQEGTDDMSRIWDEMLDNMKRDMMKKALSIALTDMFEDTFKRISQLAQDGQLNQAEIDHAIAEIDAKSAQAEAIAEQWRQAMSERGLLGDAGVDTSSGGFDAMTQDQADTLSARFTALQIEGANVATATQAMMTILEQLGINDAIKTSMLNQMMTQFTLANEIALNQLDELRKISENTSTLADTNRRLRAIEDNTNSLRE